MPSNRRWGTTQTAARILLEAHEHDRAVNQSLRNEHLPQWASAPYAAVRRARCGPAEETRGDGSMNGGCFSPTYRRPVSSGVSQTRRPLESRLPLTHMHFETWPTGPPLRPNLQCRGGLPQQPLQFNSPDLGPFKTATQPSDMTTRQGRRHRDTDLLARSLHIAS